MGSGGEAADDASLPAIHMSKAAAKNNHLLPNGDGRAPVRIPVPPVTREDNLLHNPLIWVFIMIETLLCIHLNEQY